VENTPDFNLQLPGLSISGLDAGSETAKFDLRLSMSEIGPELMGTLQYSTDLFDSPTIQRMLGHFKTLLESIAKNPDGRISELSLLSEEEERRALAEQSLLAQFHPAQSERPVECLHHLFEAQVERMPGAIAITFENEQMTYAELNRRANQLAQQLCALGDGPEVLVGLCVERSMELVIGILGILKAGGAYLPLDPSYPRERLRFMIEDAKPAVILTPEGLSTTDYTDQSHGSDPDLIRRFDPRHLCYVIYTSGSTGRPKGVAVSHQSLVNHSLAVSSAYGLSTDDRVLQFASISFDVAAEEIF
jgi:non-ribosomal peptide synthetase component F